MIETILIQVGVIGVLILAIVLLNKAKNHRIKSLERSNVALEKKLETKERAIRNLKEHSKRIKYTEKELEPIKEMVKDAKNEKDVMAAIGLLSDINNRKL